MTLTGHPPGHPCRLLSRAASILMTSTEAGRADFRSHPPLVGWAGKVSGARFEPSGLIAPERDVRRDR